MKHILKDQTHSGRPKTGVTPVMGIPVFVFLVLMVMWRINVSSGMTTKITSFTTQAVIENYDKLTTPSITRGESTISGAQYQRRTAPGDGKNQQHQATTLREATQNNKEQSHHINNSNDIQCPSFDENSACPCYKFDDGLFLECPGTTAFSLRTTLHLISSPIQSLSVYDFDQSISELTQDSFRENQHIRHLQFSHSHLQTLADNSLNSVAMSLESLSIVNGKLSQVPRQALASLEKLMVIDFESNEIRDVPDESFDGLHLMKLNLKSNLLEQISANAFKGVEMTLSEIDLSDNKLKIFPLMALRQLDNLRSLRLALNDMSLLQWDGATRLVALQFLDLSSNCFDELGDSFFRPFQKLKTVSLYSNNIKNIHRNSFKLLKDLVSLDISHNLIVELDPGIFDSNKRLQTVDLSHNYIHYVNGMFSNLPYLREVFLSENNILELTEDVFMNSTRLNVIYLEHNAIRRIDSGAFKSLANLLQLYLSANFIGRLPATLFEHTGELTSLSLDSNQIQELERGTFRHVLNLRELRLHNNKLRQIRREAFHPLPALIELHLQNNLISTIETDSFSSMRSLQHINLQGNDLHQLDVNLPSFLPSLLSIQLDANRLSQINEASFQSLVKVQILWLGHNQLTSIGRDLFRDLVNLERLLLVNNSIEKIQTGVFGNLKSLKVLDLTGNSLTEIKRNHFSPHLTNLEELILKSNRIQSIESRSFDKLNKLKLVDLSNNYFPALTKDLFQEGLQVNAIILRNSGLSKIEIGTFRNMNNLNELDLTENYLEAEDIKQLDIPSLRVLKLSSNANLNSTKRSNHENNNSLGKHYGKLEGMFDKLPSLQILKMDNCSIYELPESIFSRNTNLVKINLSHNKLRTINRNIFNGLNVFKELRMNANFLSEFPQMALSNISSLETLVLANNLITTVDFFKFNGIPNLRVLDLKNNLISSMSGFSSVILLQLDFVDLSGNYLLSLPTNFFHNSMTLSRVDLSRNRFQHIPSSALASISLPRLSCLNMTGNPLSVFYDGQSTGNKNVHTFPFLSELHISQTNLTILTSRDFDSFPALQQLFLTGNRINRISPGAFTSLKKLSTLDVSVNELERLPKERLQGLVLLRHLNLSHNSLKDLDEFSTDLAELRVLDLSFNQLTRINKLAFRGLVNLNELNLRSNRITSVVAEGLRTLQRLHVVDFRSNYFEILPLRAIETVESHLKVLRLEDNPLHCSCDSQELWEWLRDHQKLILSPSDNNDIEFNSISKQKQTGIKDQQQQKHRSQEQPQLPPQYHHQATVMLADGEGIGDSVGQSSKLGYANVQLRCDQPAELHGRALMELEPQQFCDAPLILKVAIQDIQPYSVVVSWQSRDHSGLQGYHIIYHPLDSVAKEVRSKTLGRASSSVKLFKLSSSTRYQICVLGIGSWIQYLPAAVDTSTTVSPSNLFSLTSYYSSMATIGSRGNNKIVVEQDSALELPDLEAQLTNNITAKCQEVTTLDSAPNLIMDENGLAGHSFIHSILTRRLGLIVGCCLGIIVFIVLVSVLGWLKLKKQRLIDESKRNLQPMPPEFISYRHFSIPNEEHNRVVQMQENGPNHHFHQHHNYQPSMQQGNTPQPKYISRNELGSTPLNS